MALFSRKKKEETKSTAPVVANEAAVSAADMSRVLLRPRITEKATIASMASVYVFDIVAEATKSEIAKAVERFYKVKPRKVTIVNTKGTETRNMRTGKRGMSEGVRKAYVHLKKGETITIV